MKDKEVKEAVYTILNKYIDDNDKYHEIKRDSWLLNEIKEILDRYIDNLIQADYNNFLIINFIELIIPEIVKLIYYDNIIDEHHNNAMEIDLLT